MMLFSTTQVYAFDLIVNEREFFQLSRTCQKFLYSTVGPRLAFDVPYSREEIAAARIEGENAGGAWHYCGSLVWFQRAMLAKDKTEKAFCYKQALNEVAFTAKKISPTNPLFVEVQITNAKAFYYNGMAQRSFSLLHKLVSQFPEMTPVRLELARQYRAAKNTAKAIEILQQATAPEFARSADLNYFLGVYYFHEGNLTEAKKYGDQAYKLGYPLPWLKNKLAQKGIR
jgi:tetratricopeptide (TPR) repeat protein